MQAHRPAIRTLTGWRSRAWSLVLFVALLRGLLPHAALAAVLDDGRPELAYCAPGKAAPGSPALAAALHAQCICAAAGDSLAAAAPPAVAAVLPDSAAIPLSSASNPYSVPPPRFRARGPPAHSV